MEVFSNLNNSMVLFVWGFFITIFFFLLSIKALHLILDHVNTYINKQNLVTVYYFLPFFVLSFPLSAVCRLGTEKEVWM